MMPGLRQPVPTQPTSGISGLVTRAGKHVAAADANDDQQARSMCADLAAGGSVSRISTAPSGSLRSCYQRKRGRLSRMRFKPIAAICGVKLLSEWGQPVQISVGRVSAPPLRGDADIVSRLHSFSA